ncbi:MAG: malto-oligosyltrehalose trehalohydrolase [Candidatus Margulisiibacteriota bacterium]
MEILYHIRMRTGARYLGDNRCEFTLWAPLLESVTLAITHPFKKDFPLKKIDSEHWQVTLDKVPPGTRYLFNGLPDPASHSQPDGVHGPSEVVNHFSFKWRDKSFRRPALKDLIIYELHVGAFSPEGTFEGVIKKIPHLVKLGVTAVELMPVAQFSGARNWGYDGSYPYAPQNTYGGPAGLKKLVDACHRNGLAVILDVVYNHFGPEGSYASKFAPYYTHKHKSPWGDAINFDNAHNQGVRDFFIENALYWFRDFHLDGLRLDAVHCIYDSSRYTFLAELAERAGKHGYLIAESDNNDRAILENGIHAVWCDDFHHALHTYLTGENNGYYADFNGLDDLVRSLQEGFVYQGQFSDFRGRPHGTRSADLAPERFVVFSQSHDQVGNRMLGGRLSLLAPLEALKMAAETVILSPYIPMIFMGEEFAEERPFLYFVNHLDKDLIKAVREGRKKEFARFNWHMDPPDPEDEKTFLKCKLDWKSAGRGKHKEMFEYYRKLIAERKRRGN